MRNLNLRVGEQDGFYRDLLTLVLPITFQNLMTAAVSGADVVMVGFVGQTALSAVSLASQIQFVLSLFYAGLTIGTTILVAQYVGKGEPSAVEQILGISVRFSMAISVCFAVFAIFLPGLLMGIFTSDPVLITAGIPYLKIVGISYLFMGISQMYLCIMKNVGKAVLSTLISSTTMVMNILLNGILIFGLFGAPALGITGAAVATAFSRLAELIWCLVISKSHGAVPFRLRYLWKTNPVLLKDFAKYASPVLGNELVWGCGFTMYTVIMGHLGSDAIAANSIANAVKNLVISFCLGISSGGAILLGIELGKGNLDRAKCYAARLCKASAISGALAGGLILLIKPAILEFMVLSQTAADCLSVMLSVCSYYVIAKAINSTVIAGIFCAGGDTKFGFFCDFIDMWVFAVPLGCFCAFVLKLPPEMVYFVISMDEIAKLPFVYRHYKKYGWLKNLTRELDS